MNGVYSQFEFRTSALIRLIAFGLQTSSIALQKARTPFQAGADQYFIESLSTLSGGTLRNTKPYPWTYTYVPWTGDSLFETVNAKLVEIVQPVRVTLSRVIKSGNTTTFEDAGEVEGNVIVRVDAYPGELTGLLSLSASDFEQTKGTTLGAPLKSAVIFACGPAIVVQLDTFSTTVGSDQKLNGPPVENVGVAASSDGTRVAARVQVGRSAGLHQLNEWIAFHSGNFENSVAGNDWAVILSPRLIEGITRLSIEQGLAEHKDDLRLISGVAVEWKPENGAPLLKGSWLCEVYKACSGVSSLDYDITANISLSIPAGGSTLQIDSDIERDTNDLALFGCEFVASFVGALLGSAIGISIGGFVGLSIGGMVGGIGSFIGGVIVASEFTPEMGTADCEQNGSHLTCTQPLPTTLNQFGGGSVSLTVQRATGTPQGFVIAGALPAIVGVLSTRAAIIAKPFAWTAPAMDCGVSPGVKMIVAGKIAEFVGAVAQVDVWDDSPAGLDKIIVQSVTKVSADPFNVFPESGLSIRPFGNQVQIRWTASPNIAYYLAPYSLQARVVTNGGTKVVNLGTVRQPTQQELDALRGDVMGSISMCYAMLDDFTRKYQKLNPKWLVDPPPDAIVTKPKRLWQVQVQGLQAHEPLAVHTSAGQMEVRASDRGVAIVKALTDDGEFALQRTEGAERGELPEGTPPLRYTTRQVELIEQARIPVRRSVEHMDLAKANGVPMLAWSEGGEVRSLDLSNPAMPQAFYRGIHAAVSGVRLTTDGLYVASDRGLLHYSGEGAATRVLKEPVIALERHGSELLAHSGKHGAVTSFREGFLPHTVERPEDRPSRAPIIPDSLELDKLFVHYDRKEKAIVVYQVGTVTGSYPAKAAELLARENAPGKAAAPD